LAALLLQNSRRLIFSSEEQLRRVLTATKKESKQWFSTEG